MPQTRFLSSFLEDWVRASHLSITLKVVSSAEGLRFFVPLFSFLLTDLRCNVHLLFCERVDGWVGGGEGGHTQSFTLCASLTEKSLNQPRRFRWVIPEDSVTFQQADWGPRAEAKERTGEEGDR